MFLSHKSLFFCLCLPAALSDEIDISSDSHFVVPFFLARLDCVERESETVLIMCLWKQIRFYILQGDCKSVLLYLPVVIEIIFFFVILVWKSTNNMCVLWCVSFSQQPLTKENGRQHTSLTFPVHTSILYNLCSVCLF